MKKNKTEIKRRSGCPLNASVEMLGDRWSLLIIRDMMLRGSKTFKEFLDGYEKPATNILTDRLKRLQSHGIVSAHVDSTDGRRTIYRLTQKGIDLAPVLAEMVLWAAAHEDTENKALSREMQRDKAKFIAGVRERWQDGNSAE